MQATMGKAGYVSAPSPLDSRASYPPCISALTRFPPFFRLGHVLHVW